MPSLDRARDGLTESWQWGAQWIKPLPGPKRGDRASLQNLTEMLGDAWYAGRVDSPGWLQKVDLIS